MIKAKLRRWTIYVERPDVEIPNMGQSYFLGLEFLNSFPEYVDKFQLITSEHEIITDWLPTGYKKIDVIQPMYINQRIFIKFNFSTEERFRKQEIDFSIDLILRLGYTGEK